MVQPVENGESNELAFLPFLGSWSPLGNLLSNPLMWPCPIEVLHIFANHPIELLFPQNQDVVETFSPHAAQKPFTNRIRLGRTLRRLQDTDRCARRDPREGVPIFAIAISN